jgi:hypothetical protein
MGTLLLGAAAYAVVIHWTCKRLHEVSRALEKPPFTIPGNTRL